MVKGISRQVIVVRSPDPKLFEQAIFILREDALGKEACPTGPFAPGPAGGGQLYSRRQTAGVPPGQLGLGGGRRPGDGSGVGAERAAVTVFFRPAAIE